MLHLKNRLFQPLVLHRADGTALHLLARETAVIKEAELSPDMRRSETRGHLTITTLSDSEPEPEPTSTPKKGGRK